MDPNFENIRYKKTTCVSITQNDLSEHPIRSVKLLHELWERKRPENGKCRLLSHMNLNVYILKEPTEKNQYKNEIASRLMGFIIIGPAIVYSTNGFHISIKDIENLYVEPTVVEQHVPSSNVFDILDDEEEE